MGEEKYSRHHVNGQGKLLEVQEEPLLKLFLKPGSLLAF